MMVEGWEGSDVKGDGERVVMGGWWWESGDGRVMMGGWWWEGDGGRVMGGVMGVVMVGGVIVGRW